MTNQDYKKPETTFPCEKENPPTLSDKYQVLFEFVKELSKPGEHYGNLECTASRGCVDYMFSDGVEKESSSIALEAREVLKQIGENQ